MILHAKFFNMHEKFCMPPLPTLEFFTDILRLYLENAFKKVLASILHNL